jgi:6-phospho-3-hexuloisomerase
LIVAFLEESAVSNQSDWIETAIAEIRGPLLGMDDSAIARLADDVFAARRIVLFGMGRELLQLKAFGMRLVHLGLDAHIAGDVTALPVTQGDLVVISIGPGDLDMHRAMAGLARKSGARLVVLTAQPQAAIPQMADAVVVIPAQTMADDTGSDALLPMGTVYEIALLIYLDLVAVKLRELTGQTLDEIRARHSNLE